MCCNILEQRIQPEPFAWLCIPTEHNATHCSLLNSADAEQARSHSKNNSQKMRRPLARGQRTSAAAGKIPAYCEKTPTAITPACFVTGLLRAAHGLLIFFETFLERPSRTVPHLNTGSFATRSLSLILSLIL